MWTAVTWERLGYEANVSQGHCNAAFYATTTVTSVCVVCSVQELHRFSKMQLT